MGEQLLKLKMGGENTTADGTTIVSANGRTEMISTTVTTWLKFLLKKYIGIFYHKKEEIERTAMKNIELIKKCVELANMKMTVKKTYLEWLIYLLAMRGLNKVTDRIMHKFNRSHRFNRSHNSRNRWSNCLPQDIMEKILQRLCVNDHLRVRKVCWSWRYAVARVMDEKRCAPKPQLPQLLMFNTHHPIQNKFLKFKDHTLVNLYDGGKVSHSYHAELFRKHCFGSVEGWLIIEDTFLKPCLIGSLINNEVSFNRNISFFNPLSRAKVVLPIPIYNSETGSLRYLRKAVASSVPDSRDCLVAAITRKGNLFYQRTPYIKRWYTVKPSYQGYTDIGILDGKLYALKFGVLPNIDVYNLLTSDPFMSKKTLATRPIWADIALIDSWHACNVRVLGGSKTSCFHLVTDSYSNELLLVAQIACDNNNSPKTKLFRVFITGPHVFKWLELENLGDRILFISHTSCICISASVMRERRAGHLIMGKEEDELLNEGNCIFFAFDYDCSILNHPSSKARDVGVFSLADGRIKRKNLNILRSWTTRPPLWFTPSL